jgi:mRNA interferase MazF
MTTFVKGDIVLVPFPFTDLSGVKVRPALVLSSRKVDADLIVVFITSNTVNARAHVVAITPSPKNGIKVPSGIVCNKIATLDKKIVVGKIGKAEAEAILAVDAELRKVLSL